MRRHFGLSIEGEHRPQNVPNNRWDREAYEEAVVGTIDPLMRTLVGRIVVRYA